MGAAALASWPKVSIAADLDDDDSDLDANDEVPGAPMIGGAKRAKPGDKPAPKIDAAAGQRAFTELVAARKALDGCAKSLSSGDRTSVATALSKAPFSTLEDNLLTFVQSPNLGVDDKKQIGTIKRYGSGADVLIMMGGLNAAVNGGGGGDGPGFLKKAAESLDEVILVGKGAGFKL